MRQPRIYVDLSLKVGDTLTLPVEASHYLAQVLRLKAGDKLRPFNGEDGEYLASIKLADRKKTTVIVEESLREVAAPKLMVNLGLGLSRGDRMDFAIQKSTELGVTSITPLYTQFSEVKLKQPDRVEKKLAHWQKIAVSASEQSGRLTVPKIHEPCDIGQWMTMSQSPLRVLLSPTGTLSLGDLHTEANCDLLIGSEGGFSEKEVADAVAAKFSAVTMGERIMRTETAPIAALAILQFRFGDLA